MPGRHLIGLESRLRSRGMLRRKRVVSSLYHRGEMPARIMMDEDLFTSDGIDDELDSIARRQ